VNGRGQIGDLVAELGIVQRQIIFVLGGPPCDDLV